MDSYLFSFTDVFHHVIQGTQGVVTLVVTIFTCSGLPRSCTVHRKCHYRDKIEDLNIRL